MVGRALITGVQGFTGPYLAAELDRAGYEVFGLTHAAPQSVGGAVRAMHTCDLRDSVGLVRVIEDIRPEVVVHLAAIAYVAHGDMEALYQTNLLGSRNLLEALSQTGVTPRATLLASSAYVYGRSAHVILDETTPPAPANDYAVSKLAMEYVAKLYGERLPIIIARTFNYTGVNQPESFLLPKLIGHVRRHASPIELGNLDIVRDFSDVRTVVQYYRALLECPNAPGEIYNVCSGESYALEDVLEIVRSLSGRDLEVRSDAALVRADEVKTLVGSRAKLEAAVGRVPDIPLVETLRWMLEAP